MNWITAFLPLLIPLLTSISNAWGSATGNSLQKVGGILAHAPADLVNELTAVGAALFPQLDPALHAAAAALLAAESHTGAAAWVQGALNIAQAGKAVEFSGSGTGANTPLVVDGIWGKRSTAALKAFQAKLKLPVTGMFADAEFSALESLLAKA